jgi:Cu2+-exporting ATPase
MAIGFNTQMTVSHIREVNRHPATGRVRHGRTSDHAQHDHVADYRRRFWVSLTLTVPILVLTPLIQDVLGLHRIAAFSGDSYVLFGLSTMCTAMAANHFLGGSSVNCRAASLE